MKDYFTMFAAYNRWANQRVYQACSALPPSDYMADHGAFFKSIHGTLNHILVGDRIWMKRLTGKGEAPTRLDAILCNDFSSLKSARIAEDERIFQWISNVDPDILEGLLVYHTIVNPTEVRQPLVHALGHFFNHQTHHRGQVHGLLTAITGEAPSLDLVQFQREQMAVA